MTGDGWPTTREEWERNWPDKQTRYLAWCNATRLPPPHFNRADYIAWIDAGLAAYRVARGLRGDALIAGVADATAFLWERSRADALQPELFEKVAR